ncbi:hypothetical protein AB0J21_23115 [Streptomyces sp. NPDC049954]|uniref:hypothetical protein n=1 Tax=Streptomyces sp. NPDC049954 TaxID=3155779 RepID=UPI0034204926
MARRPLPRILRDGGVPLARGRDLARTAADGATDVLHPLIALSRGLGRLAGAGRRKWSGTPKDRRGPLLFLVAALALVVGLLPYGPATALVTLLAAAAWQGRDRTPPVPEGPDEDQVVRLSSLYEALVPYFSVPEDPDPLYTYGGAWDRALSDPVFDDSGRLTELTVTYPAYFDDGDPGARAGVERLLHNKSGRGREYHFAWEEEANRLTVTALPPLPTDIAAQRFVTSPGETVLGFCDPLGVRRTLPVVDASGTGSRDVPPVVWRTGPRSAEPHLLVTGRPGSGSSTLLRSIALQALPHGEILVVDGGGSGDYACLSGRDGVLGVECSLAGALSSLTWVVRETERRLVAANLARQAGDPPPEDTRRPLWVLVDRPAVLTHLARSEGVADPQSLLQVPLRHGRAAHVTVVVAEQYDCFDALTEPVLRHTRARAALGQVGHEQVAEVLGARPGTTAAGDMPPGRGYARLGTGPVLRLQVPATPDPYDEAAADSHRQAVLDLLPQRFGVPLEKKAGAPPAREPMQEPAREPVEEADCLPAQEEPDTRPVPRAVSVAEA